MTFKPMVFSMTFTAQPPNIQWFCVIIMMGLCFFNLTFFTWLSYKNSFKYGVICFPSSFIFERIFFVAFRQVLSTFPRVVKKIFFLKSSFSVFINQIPFAPNFLKTVFIGQIVRFFTYGAAYFTSGIMAYRGAGIRLKRRSILICKAFFACVTHVAQPIRANFNRQEFCMGGLL